ncbi:MAG: hypothetical protein WAK42_27050 [Mycobacterium sp.]
MITELHTTKGKPMNKTLVGITAVGFALVALLQNELRQQKRQKHPRWALVDVGTICPN